MTDHVRYRCPRLTCTHEITWTYPPRCPVHKLLCIPKDKVERILRKIGADFVSDITWWLEVGRHGPSGGRVHG